MSLGVVSHASAIARNFRNLSAGIFTLNCTIVGLAPGAGVAADFGAILFAAKALARARASEGLKLFPLAGVGFVVMMF